MNKEKQIWFTSDTLSNEDIKNDIELGVFSSYGGVLLHKINVSKVESWLKTIERTINRDFTIRKLS